MSEGGHGFKGPRHPIPGSSPSRAPAPGTLEVAAEISTAEVAATEVAATPAAAVAATEVVATRVVAAEVTGGVDVVAGVEAVLIAVPIAGVTEGRREQRIEDQHAAEDTGARAERGLPDRRRIPPGRHRATLHPTARVVVGGLGPGLRAGLVRVALHADLALLGELPGAAGRGQRGQVGTRVDAHGEAGG